MEVVQRVRTISASKGGQTGSLHGLCACSAHNIQSQHIAVLGRVHHILRLYRGAAQAGDTLRAPVKVSAAQGSSLGSAMQYLPVHLCSWRRHWHVSKARRRHNRGSIDVGYGNNSSAAGINVWLGRIGADRGRSRRVIQTRRQPP